MSRMTTVGAMGETITEATHTQCPWVRSHVESCGVLWSHLESCGVMWSHVESCGVMRSHVVSCGVTVSLG